MKKIVCISLIVAVLVMSAFFMVACNKQEQVPSTGEFLKDVASIVKKPNAESLFDEDQVAALEKGVLESQKADDDKDKAAIAKAVMVLYNTANDSRLKNSRQRPRQSGYSRLFSSKRKQVVLSTRFSSGKGRRRRL